MSARLRPAVGRAAALWLALVLAPAARAQTDDPLADEDTAGDSADAEPSETPSPDSESDSDSDSDSESDSDSDSESDSESVMEASAESDPGSEPDAGRTVLLHAAAGLGVGTLAYTRPIAEGVQELPDTVFAAAELVLRLHAWARESLSLETSFAYQTSVGLEVQVEPLFALPEEVDVRTERLELSAAPVLRLGGADSGLALAFPIGFGYRAFVPEVHELPVRDYALGGPLARAELWLKLGELVRVRLGPEAQWIVIIDGSMRDEGACCQGLAVGGQGALEASVGPVLRVAFAYHESHSFVPLAWRFKDVERFLTARIAGEL